MPKVTYHSKVSRTPLESNRPAYLGKKKKKGVDRVLSLAGPGRTQSGFCEPSLLSPRSGDRERRSFGLWRDLGSRAGLSPLPVLRGQQATLPAHSGPGWAIKERRGGGTDS